MLEIIEFFELYLFKVLEFLIMSIGENVFDV